jgi:hypothetical protein
MGATGIVEVRPLKEWEAEFRLALATLLRRIRDYGGRRRSESHGLAVEISAADGSITLWVDEEERRELEWWQREVDTLLQEGRVGGLVYRLAHDRVVRSVRRGR